MRPDFPGLNVTNVTTSYEIDCSVFCYAAGPVAFLGNLNDGVDSRSVHYQALCAILLGDDVGRAHVLTGTTEHWSAEALRVGGETEARRSPTSQEPSLQSSLPHPESLSPGVQNIPPPSVSLTPARRWEPGIQPLYTSSMRSAVVHTCHFHYDCTSISHSH